MHTEAVDTDCTKFKVVEVEVGRPVNTGWTSAAPVQNRKRYIGSNLLTYDGLLTYAAW